MNLKQSLREASTPLMVFVPNGETASTKIKLRVFEGANKDYVLVTNLAKPKSIVAGDSLNEIAGVSETIDLKTLSNDTSVAEMVTLEGETVFVDAALAFDLLGTEIAHPVTGKPTILSYASDESEDEEDDFSEDSEEDMSGDAGDISEEEEDDSSDEMASDDEEEDTSEDESEDESEEDMSEGDSEDESVEGDDSEEASDDESEEDMSEDESEDESFEGDSEEEPVDDTSDEEEDAKKACAGDGEDCEDDSCDEEDDSEAPVEDTEVEVSSLDLVDTNKAFRLVASTNSGDEFAVFCGDSHVGTLRRNNANEAAASLYAQSAKLFSAVKPAIIEAANTGDYASLSNMGFTPVTHKFKVKSLLSKYIAREVAGIAKNSKDEIASANDRSKQVVVLASLGLFKGAFSGKLPFITELASTLAAAGVANAETVVRKVLASNAETTTRVIFEQANELAANSDDYLTGLRDSLKKADFTVSATTPNNTGPVTTVFSRGETASVSGVIDHSRTQKPANRFSRLVHGLSNR